MSDASDRAQELWEEMAKGASLRDSFELWAKHSVPYLPLGWSDDTVAYIDPRTEVAFYAWMEALGREQCDVCGMVVDKRADACHHCG